MEKKEVIETYETKRKRVQEFNLTSDLFAGKIFEDIEASQELCRILTQKPDMLLTSVKTQYVIRHLESHSVQLDILAEEAGGGIVNVELQMYKEDAPFKRTRYYTSCIDISFLEKGKEYDELPAVTVVYITRTDFIGCGKGVYQIDRKVQGNGQAIRADVDNGVCEKYFNLEYPTMDEKINELLRYLEDSNPFYQTEHFPRIVEKVNFYKMQEEGVCVMCEITDRIRREGKIEGKIEGKKEDILELLEELGKVPVKIVRRIQQETDLKVLSGWLKCAAGVSSISEFEAKM